MAINNLQAKVMKTALLTMLLTTIQIPETIAAGRTANSIANTILSGDGVPAKTLGINGDFYIDIKTMNIYGPKKNNSWPLPVSMRGPQGPTGATGADGKNGSAGSVSAGTAGPAGPQGPAGPAGPKGETGATGAQGPKGDAGTVPAIQSVNLMQWTMSTSTPGGGSESSGFGSLLAGKKYFFSVVVNGRLGTNVSTFRTVPELKCSDSSATLNSDFTYGFAPSSDAAEDYNRISFLITGTVSVTTNSSFSILVKDVLGSGRSVIFNGKGFIYEVGSIN